MSIGDNVKYDNLSVSPLVRKLINFLFPNGKRTKFSPLLQKVKYCSMADSEIWRGIPVD